MNTNIFGFRAESCCAYSRFGKLYRPGVLLKKRKNETFQTYR